jgi:hypothetical protein
MASTTNAPAPPWYREYNVGHGLPNLVDPWAATVISLIVAAVPVLVGAAMYVVWFALGEAGRAPDYTMFCLLPPAVSLVATWAWLWRTTTVSRWIRAAVFIAIAHAAIIALAWWLWRSYSAELLGGFDRSPFAVATPAPIVALCAGLAAIIGALLPRRRRGRGRVPTWLSWLVVFALLHLLLLGLWLPVSAAGWSSLLPPAKSLRFGLHVPTDGAYHTTLYTLITLIPPTVVAAALTVFARLRPRPFAKYAFVGFAALLLVATLARLSTDYNGYVAYATMVHILIAEAALALLCIVALGVAKWRALRTAHRDTGRQPPWMQHGTVEASSDTADDVGWVTYDSWLGGLRPTAAGFHLRTDRGMINVPAGAQLIVPAPSWTTSADAGQRETVLRVGDEVTVTGYMAAKGEGTYRSGGLPVPGTSGLVVTMPRADHETLWRDVLLVVWRPCVFYALVATVIAIPGVIAIALV